MPRPGDSSVNIKEIIKVDQVVCYTQEVQSFLQTFIILKTYLDLPITSTIC